MALKNYTTTISVDKTIGEIQRLLAKAGASKVMTEYDDTGNIVALSFQLKLGEDYIAFSLPTDWRPVEKVLLQQRVVPAYRSEEQARRTAWRITKDWVDAQLAIIETKMVTTAQVFLPYAVTNSGETLYQHIAQNNTLLLGGGRDA
jgi:hypothetical protein